MSRAEMGTAGRGLAATILISDRSRALAVLFASFLSMVFRLGRHCSIVMATIALGVGANTAIFTIVYATQFAPLPFPEPRQLVSIWSIVNSHKDNPTPRDFLVWRDHVSSFEGLSAFASNGFDVGERGQTENIFGMRVV